MEIRVLGAHNRESATTRAFSLLVDGRLAIDAGSLGSALTLAEQANIQAILLSHMHLDHIKDVPTIGFNTLFGPPIEVFTAQETHDQLCATLLRGEIWLELFTFPPEQPSLIHRLARPRQPFTALGAYRVTPVPSDHKVGALGFYVEHATKSFLYTCDTGPGFVAQMRDLTPQLIITEVTLSNEKTELARLAKHLTPAMLHTEILALKARSQPLPKLLIIHVDPFLEPTIRSELKTVAADTGATIEVATTDQRVVL